MKIRIKPIRTSYWRPGTDYGREIAEAVRPYLRDGDILAVSEKAVSTAQGNLVDESRVQPGRVAGFLAGAWTRRLWGGPLGRLTRLKDKTMENLRGYPAAEGAAHKQTTIWYAGLAQSLRHYSEGGIDASNLPYSYVCLPLRRPTETAKEIAGRVKTETGKNVTVMIVDGDTTYTWRSLHLAPRRVEAPGLVHIGGFLPFVMGRALGLRARQTPVAVAGGGLNPDRALWLASLYHRRCGRGAGRTVWGMAESMGTDLTGVTWGMMDDAPHHPVAVIRLRES
jgi:F420-0:gamma-glutamyl ligase-like protein